MKSGVYKILNILNGKCYIGSSEFLNRRIKDHRIYLKNNTHSCKHLQNSYNKYGKAAFVFGVIEYCEIDKLIEREQFWIDKTDISIRYNKRRIAQSNKGFKFSAESKEKLKKRIPWNKGVKTRVNFGTPIKKGQRLSKSTEFTKGFTPWNKGTKGVCKANRTSFGFGNQKNRYGNKNSSLLSNFIPYSFGHIDNINKKVA